MPQIQNGRRDMALLSTMDATFLYIESPETPMHVAGLSIFRPKEGYTGNIFEDYRKFIADRVHLLSYLHRRLGQAPLAPFDPIWVDDYDLDWDYHIRHNALPHPGTPAQLNELVERLHAVQLDRNRPLWQFYVIEGLEEGGFALYTKTHHACLDGGAGILTMDILYDKTPEISEVEAPHPSGKKRKPQPEWLQQMSESYLKYMRQQIDMLEAAPRFVESLGQLARSATGIAGTNPSVQTPPRTSINGMIGRERSFSTLSLPLAEVKTLGKSVGAKINDVMMSLCGGALRRYLIQLDELPNEPLVAGVPASLRKPGDYKMNNQVTMMMASLGTDIADPLERIQAISTAMSEAKDRLEMVKDTIHFENSYYGAALVVTALQKLSTDLKIADRAPPPMNLVVSNVPGSPRPWYLLGHEMKNQFPVSIPGHGIGLNITVQSYMGSIDIGIVSAKSAIPETDLLQKLLLEEYDLFREVVEKATAPEKNNADAPKPVKIQIAAKPKIAKKQRKAPASNGVAKT
jgi:diacylglycerol O-acyltransferase / wax synthase